MATLFPLHIEHSGYEVFLFLSEHQILPQGHLYNLLLVRDEHDKRLCTEVRHKHRNDSFSTPSGGLLLGYLDFKPERVEDHEVEESDRVFAQCCRATEENHGVKKSLKLLDLLVSDLLSRH